MFLFLLALGTTFSPQVQTSLFQPLQSRLELYLDSLPEEAFSTSPELLYTFQCLIKGLVPHTLVWDVMTPLSSSLSRAFYIAASEQEVLR